MGEVVDLKQYKKDRIKEIEEELIWLTNECEIPNTNRISELLDKLITLGGTIWNKYNISR